MVNGGSMRLSVFKCPPKVKPDAIKDAVRFYASVLMHKNLVKNLGVIVTFDDNGLDGSCTINDDFVKPREFIVQVNPKRSVKEIFCALAHEMVHVKQYATSESKNYERQPWMVRYRGEMVNTNTTSYWDQPWEIEAYGRELGLYVRFLENKNEKAKADKKKPGR